MRHSSNAVPLRTVLAALAVLGLAAVLPVAAPGAPHSPAPGTMRTSGLAPASSLGVSPAPSEHTGTSASGRPAAGPVNPQGSYSAEPAPMGVADFGIDGLGEPYSYTTSLFEGAATLTALKANDVGDPSAGNVAFELNTVLTFRVGTQDYVYWLQDGFDVESHSERVSLLQDYVWNFSAAVATLNSSSVAGNGTFVNAGGYDIYISYPAKTLPGYDINLSFPMELELRIVTGTFGPQGIPWVGYDYNDGFGWVRGSNVSFPFATGAVNVGQTVNGDAYTPHGAYYDAEFVYAGPGGGVGTDVGSQMQMTLDRWNGNNLAAVPNAYDHGGNTGERIENLSVAASQGPGSPGSVVSAGTGSLGLLYSSNQTATVEVRAPWASGTIGVNGAPVAFTGGEADLNLLAGSYVFTLYNGSEVVGRTSALVVAQQNLILDLGANLLEPVTVTASGLPSGTPWSIDWNGTHYEGTAPSILVFSLNGTYPVSTSAIPGYVPRASELSVDVRGSTNATIDWATFNYTVTFTEGGLPTGTEWWVTAGGVTNLSTQTTLSLELPNGTSPYSVGCAFAYFPSLAHGNVTVYAAPERQMLTFDAKPSYLVGTVTPSGAAVGINGVAAPTTGGSFNLTVLPGAYRITAALAGYAPFSENVTTTAGNVTPIAITLQPLPSSSPAASTSTWSTEELAAIAGAAAVVAVGVGLVFARRRRPPPPPRG